MTAERVFGCRHRFVGRNSELERVTAAAREGRSLVVSGDAGVGVSELLKQAFDRLFFAGDTLPIYFEVRLDEGATDAARRFARQVVANVVAFRSGDASFLRRSPAIEEAARFTTATDSTWIDEAVEAIDLADESEITPVCIALPTRIALAKVTVLIDGLEQASAAFLDEIKRLIAGDIAVIAGGSLETACILSVPRLVVANLAVAKAADLVASLCDDAGVQTSERTCDLIAVQLEGNPHDIRDLILEAADEDMSLLDFKSVEHVYTRSIAHGRLSRSRRRAGGRVSHDTADTAMALADSRRTQAAVLANLTIANFARAPRLMTEFYRSGAAIGVSGLLSRFYGQSVPRATVAYGMFKEEYKGQAEELILTSLAASADTFELPRIVHSDAAAEFYPAIAELSDPDRSALGLTGTGEAWLMAEIDSKLEADAATAEFWCDRLEMAAVNAGCEQFRVWLIAPEGFDDEAREILAERNALGTSRQQIELLKKLLDQPPHHDSAATTYEITVPMGDEGETTATRKVGEICAKHGIPEKVVTHIKTALVEALINAAEHSLSPDRRVRLTFTVDEGQLTVTVTNRGVRLADMRPKDIEGSVRGWGLKLMKKLMDEVRLEPTDDGTRLVMIKRCHVAEEPSP